MNMECNNCIGDYEFVAFMIKKMTFTTKVKKMHKGCYDEYVIEQ